MSRDELRERLADLPGVKMWDGFVSVDGACFVDAILTEIERDCVILERGRAERLLLAASASECFHDDGSPCLDYSHDLDPFPEAP